tara:strand:- start:2686 stop:3132 length:447 start_codon:yes stop_codon:yes gene_type:complete
MTAFDRAWDIVKKDDDYSKFGEKFAEKMKKLREGGRGLPEGTKFSDLRPTSDNNTFARPTDPRPPMPKGVPIDILDLPNYRPDPGEEENQRILARIMGAKDYDDAVDMIDQMERHRMEAESAKMRGHVNIPDSLIDRVRRTGRTPKDD